ncbi:hypothetical protein CCACVL1_13895, partial [Corchorus capsularis]
EVEYIVFGALSCYRRSPAEFADF